MMKKRYFAIPILAIALHFLLSNLLYFLVETSLDKGTQRKTTENELPSLTQCTA